jgi:hypothetical protein
MREYPLAEGAESGVDDALESRIGSWIDEGPLPGGAGVAGRYFWADDGAMEKSITLDQSFANVS